MENTKWQYCGEIEVGRQNTNPLSADLCDENGVMWNKMTVLRCTKCGKMVREYPQYVSGLNYCPRCGENMNKSE